MEPLKNKIKPWIFIYPTLFIIICGIGSYYAGVKSGKIIMCEEMGGTLTIDYGCLDAEFVNQALDVQTNFPPQYMLLSEQKNTTTLY
jgi:hypothetical protein